MVANTARDVREVGLEVYESLEAFDQYQLRDSFASLCPNHTGFKHFFLPSCACEGGQKVTLAPGAKGDCSGV